MATFEVNVVKIDDVQDHPNADRLTLVKIGGYTCISNKHEDGSWRYQPGDLVVYIPENAVVPEWLLQKMNMWNEEKEKGILAGKRGDRVKAIKLRGIFSEGIIYPVINGILHGDIKWDQDDGEELCELVEKLPVVAGQNVSEFLGVTKYEPPIPTQMAGEVFNLGYAPVKFDLEPIEKYPNLFDESEIVDITEKLHGTFTGISIIPGLDHPEAFTTPSGSRDVVVYSKGLGGKGLVFKDNETNINNLYVRAWKYLDTSAFWEWYEDVIFGHPDITIHILGETYGAGVQDLSYGLSKTEFRVFAIGTTENREYQWACYDSILDHTEQMNVDVVPRLYQGPFTMGIVEHHRDGQTTLGGDHIREGVVITTSAGRYDPEFGYIRLKAVSPDYKLRKGGTEYN